MTIQALIQRLIAQQQADRWLDVGIAEALGWERKADVVRDAATGDERKNLYWLRPSDREPALPPHYTSNLQHAYELLQIVSPSLEGGFSWESGKGGAKLDEGDYVEAATPQLAICLTALLKLESRRELNGKIETDAT